MGTWAHLPPAASLRLLLRLQARILKMLCQRWVLCCPSLADLDASLEHWGKGGARALALVSSSTRTWPAKWASLAACCAWKDPIRSLLRGDWDVGDDCSATAGRIIRLPDSHLACRWHDSRWTVIVATLGACTSCR